MCNKGYDRDRMSVSCHHSQVCGNGSNCSIGPRPEEGQANVDTESCCSGRQWIMLEFGGVLPSEEPLGHLELVDGEHEGRDRN